MTDLKTSSFDLAVLGHTVFGEASSENSAARLGVASSALNRARTGTFPGGHSVAGVCLAHRQYDCWDAGTPDCIRTLEAGDSDTVLRECLEIAAQALSGAASDNTGGAVFYHDETLKGPPVVWGVVHLTAEHGNLKFYAAGAAAQ